MLGSGAQDHSPLYPRALAHAFEVEASHLATSWLLPWTCPHGPSAAPSLMWEGPFSQFLRTCLALCPGHQDNRCGRMDAHSLRFPGWHVN